MGKFLFHFFFPKNRGCDTCQNRPVCAPSIVIYIDKVKVGHNDEIDELTKEGPPAKVVWYLPIIPRLKRLFANVDDAKNLRWHADNRKCDGLLRHPADSL